MLQYSDDDSIHETGSSPVWRESFYCNFFDAESRFYGVAYIGVRPDQQLAESMFLLFEEDRPLIHYLKTDLRVPADIDRRAVGFHRFECLEPWRHWQVHYDDGSAQITLDWQQLTQVVDHDPVGTPGEAWWSKGRRVAGDNVRRALIRNALAGSNAVAAPSQNGFYGAAKHFEASGKIEVSGEIDGRPIWFEGFGTRDRAWGPRKWGLLGFAWWQTVQFPDGDALHVLVMQESADDEFKLFGLLHRDGRSRPMMRVECEVGYDGDPGPPIAVRQRFTDDERRELVIESMDLLHEHVFAITADGENIADRDIAFRGEYPYYWTWQRFVRQDGVVGHGMIDQACWPGMQYTSFTSTLPTGRLYDFGVERARV